MFVLLKSEVEALLWLPRLRPGLMPLSDQVFPLTNTAYGEDQGTSD